VGILVALIATVTGAMIWRARSQARPRYDFVTAKVERGTLAATVTATGDLHGLDTVQIGAEISGLVKAVYVDFNDHVEKGQLLAEIDLTELTAQRDQVQAQLSAARAEYDNRKATAKETRLAADRMTELGKGGLVSSQQLEAATAAADRADAAVRSGAAQITLNEAMLKSAETKLKKTKIVSPLTGVVLSRTVEPGQTVAASLQAPVLFVLARDLKTMELTVNIDEADIGMVHPGQPATFSVDAYPSRTFPAELKAIHNVGTTVDNVVTYEARLSVDNSSLELRPDMTATATIVTSSKDQVLMAPNAALRFTPPDLGPAQPKGFLFFGGGGSKKGGAPRASDDSAHTNSKRKETKVWINENGLPKPVVVKTGVSDGQRTEIVSDELHEGDLVITDFKEAAN
jgi:HlyD family secretion protein